MESFVELAQYLNSHVSPYCFSATLVFAAELNGVTAYLFTASFLAWVSLVCMYVTAMVYKHGLMEFLTRWVSDYANHVLTQLKQLQHFYIVKAAVGVLLAYLVGSCLLCARHVDIVEAIQSTVEFIVRIPALIFDTDGLIQVIQQWLHRVFLSHIVTVLGTLWRWQKELIAASLLWGALSVCGMFVVITIILECAVWVHRSRWVLQFPDRVITAWRCFKNGEKPEDEIVFVSLFFFAALLCMFLIFVNEHFRNNV